jgi:drug/metabolite transporter (DMT)-like permease
MVSALFWGVTEALAKVVVRSVSPLIFTWGRALMLLPAFGIMAAFSKEGVALPQTPALWAGVIGLAIVGPVLGRYFYMKSLTLIPVSKTALINQLQPVWVALLAGFILKTLPGPRAWLGGALILSGCVLLVRRLRNKTDR